MLIDTHCHLDADAFSADREAVVARARERGVTMMVLAAGHAEHFGTTAEVAHRYGLAYALGTHPLWIDRAVEAHIDLLREIATRALDDARFVAIGEIGIDGVVAGLDPTRQQWFFREQLKVARDLGLPVIVHVRRSADLLLKHLRQIRVPGGIVHAFNGSREQADALLGLGLRLGFGGAMTYAGSLRIRRFAATLPDDAWVLETDAPDIPPQWLRDRETGVATRNEPGELPRIAGEMAALRGWPLARVIEQNRRNACVALPRLAALLG
jgi:TatD DNase family protein